MDWTSVAIFHHADQELLLGSSKSNNKSYKRHEEIKLFTSTASPTANNQHINNVSEPSQFLTSFQTLKVYDLHSSGISKEPLLLASNRGLASPSAKMDDPGRKDGELKYAWGGVDRFFWFEVGIDFSWALGRSDCSETRPFFAQVLRQPEILGWMVGSASEPHSVQGLKSKGGTVAWKLSIVSCHSSLPTQIILGFWIFYPSTNPVSTIGST